MRSIEREAPCEELLVRSAYRVYRPLALAIVLVGAACAFAAAWRWDAHAPVVYGFGGSTVPAQEGLLGPVRWLAMSSALAGVACACVAVARSLSLQVPLRIATVFPWFASCAALALGLLGCLLSHSWIGWPL